MDELRRLSTRAEITATSFTNTYHWGDFKGDPTDLMKRYFDVFVYVANWGTHQIAFRIPRGFLEPVAVQAYAFEDDEEHSLVVSANKDHVMVAFYSQTESGDWDEGGEVWMPSLLPIRDELMRGDLRALYIGWLAAISHRTTDEVDEDEIEPPVPPGLAMLSGPLKELVEFLRVDEDLLEVAAAASKGEAIAAPSRADMAQWIRSLPATEKDEYLVRFAAADGDVLLRAELARRFREATSPRPRKADVRESGRRTVSELLAARDVQAGEKARKAAEDAAREKARRDRERAEARTRHLSELARREAAAWKEVEDLIATSKQDSYDHAVDLLVDLREIAEQSGRAEESAKRLRELRGRYAKRPTLIKRFDSRKL